ncbi:MAG: DNA repair protein RadA [FCB group bacterium]|nr:DNA repair protein RadA [FCB group bacterium]MBL7029172.1 DNA repair protein RadA [Candidatus Neomarinimicrobiota bacterium]MBL7122987.1 DNA repair protein RadA [Candidatus Neomarinimicrobiota bacterium]
MAKSKTVYVCDDCGAEHPKWVGRCGSCGAWETVKEFKQSKLKVSRSGQRAELKPLDKITRDAENRIKTSQSEFDSVVGGGLVKGSIILFGGQPGIGKSTLLLQLSGLMAAAGHPILYFSGEESGEQLAMRADRLGVKAEKLMFANDSVVENIARSINELKPAVVIVDSIQTAYSEAGENLPGSISQVRESAALLLRVAKEMNVCIILVGHITKDGYLAGPKMLEHLVDTVLYLEGDRQSQVRLLRAAKNRFGSTSELGVYEMAREGLIPVENPAKLFLSQRHSDVSGTVVVTSQEGSRTFFLEVQALVASASYGNPQRNVTGFDLRRLQMLLAVLERRAGFQLGTQDVFINVVSGLKIAEPAADLGVAIAIISSLKNRVVDAGALIIGEVGLGGEVRNVGQIRRRVEEAKKLGFNRIILPHGEHKGLADLGLAIVPVRSLSAAVDEVF